MFLSTMLAVSQSELYSQLSLYGAYGVNSRLFWRAERSLQQVEDRLAHQGFDIACHGLFGCDISLYQQSACATQYRIKVCESSGHSKQCLVSIYKLSKVKPGCALPVTARRLNWARVFD